MLLVVVESEIPAELAADTPGLDLISGDP